jgi:hypothetical protein
MGTKTTGRKPSKPAPVTDGPARTPEDEDRDSGLDRTLEESFPASDAPSTIPDPRERDESTRDRGER